MWAGPRSTLLTLPTAPTLRLRLDSVWGAPYVALMLSASGTGLWKILLITNESW